MKDMLPDLKPHYGQLPEVLEPEGKPRARVALFLGCVADALYPETNLATARVLQANGCEVWIPRVAGVLRGAALPRGRGTAARAVRGGQLRRLRRDRRRAVQGRGRDHHQRGRAAGRC